MTTYLDLLIEDDDLSLDNINVPKNLVDLDVIAQDIKHMIRESGLLMQVIAERDRVKRERLMNEVKIRIENDRRIIPGTVRIVEKTLGTFFIVAESELEQSLQVTL